MTPRLCPSCKAMMAQFPTVSVDEKTVRITFLCTRCLHRESAAEPNPRFDPLGLGNKHPKFQQHEREF